MKVGYREDGKYFHKGDAVKQTKGSIQSMLQGAEEHRRQPGKPSRHGCTVHYLLTTLYQREQN